MQVVRCSVLQFAHVLLQASCADDGTVRVYEATDIVNLASWSGQVGMPCAGTRVSHSQGEFKCKAKCVALTWSTGTCVFACYGCGAACLSRTFAFSFFRRVLSLSLFFSISRQKSVDVVPSQHGECMPRKLTLRTGSRRRCWQWASPNPQSVCRFGSARTHGMCHFMSDGYMRAMVVMGDCDVGSVPRVSALSPAPLSHALQTLVVVDGRGQRSVHHRLHHRRRLCTQSWPVLLKSGPRGGMLFAYYFVVCLSGLLYWQLKPFFSFDL